jgi:hypothetical protein
MPTFSLQDARIEQVKNVSYGNFANWSESATYGYFGGDTSPTLCTISRLDFSNETCSDPGNNLPVERQNLSATSNSN